MNCREALADIALYAGGDLDDRDRVQELRQHVAGCPECREHFQSLKSTLKTLATVGPMELGGATWQSAGSLWPSIRQELARPPEPFTAARAFNAVRPWAPFAAMTVACVVMLVSLGHIGAPATDQQTTRGLLPTHPPTAMTTPHDDPPPPRTESDSHGRPLQSASAPGF